jgi:hypothetical protein
MDEKTGKAASSLLVSCRRVWIVKNNRREFPAAFRLVEQVGDAYALQ